MSKICEITGLSKSQTERWAYYHNSLTGSEIIFDTAALSDEYFSDLSEQIKNKMEKSQLSKKEKESRKKLFTHLKKTIAGR